MLGFSSQGDDLQCGNLVVLQGVAGVAFLIAAFAGYRIYTVSIGLCGALSAAAIVVSAGFIWYGGTTDINDLLSVNMTSTADVNEVTESEEPVKLGIIAFFCVVWGVMGAVICMKTQKVIHKILGFICGAVLGIAMVSVTVLIASSQVPARNEDDVNEYAGWQWYTIFAAGVPISCIVGYATRNLIVYVLMASTAFLGSFVGVALLGHALECAAQTRVEPMIVLGVAVLSTIAGFVVQVKMTPEVTPQAKQGCESAPPISV